MRILNVYGQAFYHQEAKIIGNTEGLLELKITIERALQSGKDKTASYLVLNKGKNYKPKLDLFVG